MVVIIEAKECFVKVSFDLKNEKMKHQNSVSFEGTNLLNQKMVSGNLK